MGAACNYWLPYWILSPIGEINAAPRGAPCSMKSCGVQPREGPRRKTWSERNIYWSTGVFFPPYISLLGCELVSSLSCRVLVITALSPAFTALSPSLASPLLIVALLSLLIYSVWICHWICHLFHAKQDPNWHNYSIWRI